MMVTKILGTVSLLAIVGFASSNAMAESRGSVAAGIAAACAPGKVCSCGAINPSLAAAAALGKTPEGLAIAAGVGDAVAAIGKVDPDLGTRLATCVATNGSAWVQVAFGAVLDGTGTASTGGGSVGSGSPAGSAG
jgi:hypothetical protein